MMVEKVTCSGCGKVTTILYGRELICGICHVATPVTRTPKQEIEPFSTAETRAREAAGDPLTYLWCGPTAKRGSKTDFANWCGVDISKLTQMNWEELGNLPVVKKYSMKFCGAAWQEAHSAYSFRIDIGLEAEVGLNRGENYFGRWQTVNGACLVALACVWELYCLRMEDYEGG